MADSESNPQKGNEGVQMDLSDVDHRVGNLVGGVQSLFGGNLSVYTNLAETARQEAYDLLVGHATEVGANAVIGMRYDANEIMDGITEVLAYGTAVQVEPAP